MHIASSIMLWKKETLYIDIFKPNTQHWDSILNSKIQAIEQKPHPEKSDAIALEKRNQGNEMFRGSAILKALELYGDSLRFAPPGSEHISLAYANRAACFLKMKMYDECLIDIDYAVAAGYPAHLRAKLDERKTRCLKEMQENAQHPREKLSIEPNEKFSCLSNAVKVQRNSEKGDYSLVAAADVDVGQAIIIDDLYHGYVKRLFGIYCNICGKDFCNLVPCGKCAVAMFCPECQGHFLHEHECGLNFCGENDFNTEIMTAVRGLLLVFKAFSTADELMVFVEQMLKKPNQLPERMLDDRSKYQAYFNCPNKFNADSLDDGTKTLIIYSVHKTLLRIPYVQEMFATAKHQRFLMHLIGHHARIFRVAAGMVSQNVGTTSSAHILCTNPVMHSYIKHSCCPNIENAIADGKCVTYSIKPIKKGEQLLRSYPPYEIKSTSERKKFLWDSHQIKCECSRCQGKEASPTEREQLLFDPSFRYMYANIRSLDPLKFNIKKVESLMDACVSVLQKYGQLDWCEEIDYVIKRFRTLYKIKLLGGGADFNHPLAREHLSHCK